MFATLTSSLVRQRTSTTRPALGEANKKKEIKKDEGKTRKSTNAKTQTSRQTTPCCMPLTPTLFPSGFASSLTKGRRRTMGERKPRNKRRTRKRRSRRHKGRGRSFTTGNRKREREQKKNKGRVGSKLSARARTPARLTKTRETCRGAPPPLWCVLVDRALLVLL